MHSSPQYVEKRSSGDSKQHFQSVVPWCFGTQVRDLRPERAILTSLSNILQNRPANCCQDYRLHNWKDIPFSFTRRKLLSISTTDNVTVKRNKNKTWMLFLVHDCLTDSVVMPLATSPVRWSKNNKHACPSHSNRFTIKKVAKFHTNASKYRWLIRNETSALT